MIETFKHEHNLPRKEYVKVYYTDNYTILCKEFSNIDYAKPFIKMLIKNTDFHLIQVRIVNEMDFNL